MPAFSDAQLANARLIGVGPPNIGVHHIELGEFGPEAPALIQEYNPASNTLNILRIGGTDVVWDLACRLFIDVVSKNGDVDENGSRRMDKLAEDSCRQAFSFYRVYCRVKKEEQASNSPAASK